MELSSTRVHLLCFGADLMYMKPDDVREVLRDNKVAGEDGATDIRATFKKFMAARSRAIKAEQEKRMAAMRAKAAAHKAAVEKARRERKAAEAAAAAAADAADGEAANATN